MIEFDEKNGEFLAAIPDYLRVSVDQMISAGLNYDQIIDELLGGAGGGNISPHGVLGGSRKFAENFRSEFRLLLCTEDKKYKDIRGSFEKHGGKVGYASCSTIAVALAPFVGIAAVALAPVIAVAAHAVVKMGKSAWCDLHK